MRSPYWRLRKFRSQIETLNSKNTGFKLNFPYPKQLKVLINYSQMNFQEFEQQVKACTKCDLSKTRINVVPGEGAKNAQIMLIGEGPGKNEDEQGLPFIGAAGKFLTQLIESIGLTREEVYIANVVKCRPPANRDPLPQEVQACWPWLEFQISQIKPTIIVLLGRHSLMRFFPDGKISQDHGRALRKPFGDNGKIIFFPCYHPAAALYNGSLRSTLEKDFKKIPKILEIVQKEEQEKNKNEKSKQNKKEPRQESLL